MGLVITYQRRALTSHHNLVSASIIKSGIVVLWEVRVIEIS